jgi:hypothetical protein
MFVLPHRWRLESGGTVSRVANGAMTNTQQARDVQALCQPPNNRLQRTVTDRVPRHLPQRAAAELRRYTQFSEARILRPKA